MINFCTRGMRRQHNSKTLTCRPVLVSVNLQIYREDLSLSINYLVCIIGSKYPIILQNLNWNTLWWFSAYTLCADCKKRMTSSDTAAQVGVAIHDWVSRRAKFLQTSSYNVEFSRWMPLNINSCWDFLEDRKSVV